VWGRGLARRGEPTEAMAELVSRTEGLQPGRRLFHAANGLLIAGALYLLAPSRYLSLPLLGGVALALLALDLVRLRHEPLNRLFFRLLRPFASPREAEGVASSTWYMVGCTLAVALFSPAVAVQAILLLALADPAAGYAGRRWGRRRLGTGTGLGTAVFLLTGTLTLLPWVPLPGAILVSAGVAAAELLPWKVDDNLVIPLVAGLLLSLLPVLPILG